MAWQALIPLAASAAASYFGSKGDKSGGTNGSAGSVSMQPLMPEWQMSLGKDLSDWSRKFLQLYNPGAAYGGNLSAAMTGIEGTGLKELNDMLMRPATGELYDAAKTQVLDTLNGKFADPSTSPFIQAYSRLAGQNLRDSINMARGQRGARGTYYTDAGIREESQLTERTQNYMNALIGDFMNSERGRQLTAVGSAKDLEKYRDDATIGRVTASQTLGALPRVLEQAELERNYQAWLNQRKELGAVPGTAQSVFGENIPMLTTTTSPAPATGGQDAAPWITLAMRYLPQLMNMQGGGAIQN